MCRLASKPPNQKRGSAQLIACYVSAQCSFSSTETQLSIRDQRSDSPRPEIGLSYRPRHTVSHALHGRGSHPSPLGDRSAAARRPQRQPRRCRRTERGRSGRERRPSTQPCGQWAPPMVGINCGKWWADPYAPQAKSFIAPIRQCLQGFGVELQIPLVSSLFQFDAGLMRFPRSRRTAI